MHYAFTHIVGTSGGNMDDIHEALQLMADGRINPAGMIIHIGGLDAVIETTRHLPDIPGGKKLIYTHKKFPLVALEKLSAKSEDFPFMAKLDKMVKENDGLWSLEAEKYVMENAPNI